MATQQPHAHDGVIPTLPPSPKFLIVMLRYLGDVLLTTPVIQVLKEKYPQSTISLVVHAGTESVLEHNPHIQSVLVVPRGGWKEQLQFVRHIRSNQFDCVIDLTDGDRAAFLARCSGAKIRIGFNEEKKWRGKFFSFLVMDDKKDRHRVERNFLPLRMTWY